MCIEVRNIKIGSGIPKICVPIIGQTSEEILASAMEICKLPHDLIEWRVDWFEGCKDNSAVAEVLMDLRNAIGETPLLFTFRTKAEGGERSMDTDAYINLNKTAIESGLIDLVDVELFTGDECVSSIIRCAHKNNVYAIVSNHDFEATPDKEEIINRLTKMAELGADIPKIAVTPTDKKDVLTLLSATSKVAETIDKPIITMSMKELGVVSRLTGELFGSAITFGSAESASAPGQIPAEYLEYMLKKMHEFF